MALLVFAGCRGVPVYTGEGENSNTTSWEDNLARVRQYTIRLPSFSLNRPVETEYRVGDIAFFKKTGFCVHLRFRDDHDWKHFTQLAPSMKTPGYAVKYKMRDIDELKGQLDFRVFDTTGATLVNCSRLLKDYTWSGLKGEVELYDIEKQCATAVKGEDLKIRLSYTGDTSLTNQAYLTVVVLPR